MTPHPARDNGLFAQAYTPVRDLEPRLTERVLELLRQRQVAAYVSAEADTGHRHVDRLWVDREAEREAQLMLDRALPQLRAELDAADEQAWAEIVASFESPGREPSGGAEPPRWQHRGRAGWGAAGSHGAAGAGAPDGHGGAGDRADEGPRDSADDDGDDWGVEPTAPVADPDDWEEHFEPPAPPPLPAGDSVTRAAWIGLVGGPLYLVVALVLGLEVAGWPALLAVAAFVAGFITLIARMPDRRGDDDDDADGGAVV